ncbi:MAG TPA: glycerophosphodiester phosphodiesterase family protein [Candidatus Brocadiia bacterium]|nr:glycerophosphodiester phosphodiesterase family protein [Candidatus Brocadiia bacterium]
MRTLTFAVPILLASAASIAFAQQDDLMNEDFEKAGGNIPAGWKAVSGKWKIESGRLVADALDGEAYIRAGDEGWTDYEMSADAVFLKVKEPSRWLSLIFRASADGREPWSQFAVRQQASKDSGVEFAVRIAGGGWSVRAPDKAAADCRIGEPRRLRIAVRGQKVEAFLDDKPLFESWFCVDRSNGCVGLGASGCLAAFDNVKVKRLPPGQPAQKPADNPGRCECVAHRGFSALAPENTLISVVKGMEAGADGCEFDVYLSKDGVPVLMHDDKLDRTTNGKGSIHSYTAEELGKVDAGSWKGAQYKGEPVPKLVDVLRAMKGKGVTAVIEIKQDGMAKEVMDALSETGMMDNAAIISFKDKALFDINKLGGKMPRGFLLGEKLSGTTAQQADYLVIRAKACGANVLDLNYRMLNPELVAELQKRGYPVWCWTVDEEPVMKALAEWGVDSVTTNRPDALVALRKRMGGAKP